MVKIVISIALLLAIVVGSFVFLQGRNDFEPEPVIPEKLESGQMADLPVGLDNYLPYDANNFNTALTEGKMVSLYFLANWCPICKAQEPVNREVMENIGPNVVLFKVNILDSETTKEGEALAEKYDVRIQHTFVFVDSNGNKIDSYVGKIGPDELEEKLTQER